MTRIHVRTLAAVLSVALAASLAAPRTASAQGGPIKIGLLAPLTGAAAALGKDMLNGTELYLEIGRASCRERV